MAAHGSVEKNDPKKHAKKNEIGSVIIEDRRNRWKKLFCFTQNCFFFFLGIFVGCRKHGQKNKTKWRPLDSLKSPKNTQKKTKSAPFALVIDEVIEKKIVFLYFFKVFFCLEVWGGVQFWSGGWIMGEKRVKGGYGSIRANWVERWWWGFCRRRRVRGGLEEEMGGGMGD